MECELEQKVLAVLYIRISIFGMQHVEGPTNGVLWRYRTALAFFGVQPFFVLGLSCSSSSEQKCSGLLGANVTECWGVWGEGCDISRKVCLWRGGHTDRDVAWISFLYCCPQDDAGLLSRSLYYPIIDSPYLVGQRSGYVGHTAIVINRKIHTSKCMNRHVSLRHSTGACVCACVLLGRGAREKLLPVTLCIHPSAAQHMSRKQERQWD